MTMQHETTFEIDGVEIEVEWEMDCSIPVWNIVGEDTCNGPNLTEDQRQKIEVRIDTYMYDYYQDYD